MDPATRSHFLKGVEGLGIELSVEAVDRFERYLDLLLRWNVRIQLTSVVEPGAVVERHFIDSLAVAPSVAGFASLVDVGSGGGFPGVPLAILWPEVPITLVESIQKKAAFLEALRRELKLPRMEVVAGRMESLLAQGRRFEVAVSRATFAPEEWVRRGAGLVLPGGRLIAMVVPGEGLGIDSWAPHWRDAWAAAELRPPYAAGRALLVLSGHRPG